MTITERHSAKIDTHRIEFVSYRITQIFLLAGALDSVEKLPPHIERSLDRSPHLCALDFAHRRMSENIIADVTVIAIRDFMHDARAA